MSKKHKKYRTPDDIRNSIMDKTIKFRGKTGKFVDWHEVDKATTGNSSSFFELLKKVWNIAIGNKNENKA